MTPEEIKSRIESTEQDLKDLRDYFDLLTSSNSFPRDVETAIRERFGGFVISSGTTGSASTQSVSVPSTPTNITVPAQPTGTIAVTINGTTYNLLYK